jgi:hypothetical protein
MLKEHILRMLNEFIIEIKNEQWFGKERELVSRFAFSKLIKNIGCCEQLFDPAQIAIEVRVKQITENGKKEVCKDLIIWSQPNQTVWGKYNVPLCIMEWKHRNKLPYEYDIDWLEKYTSVYKDCFGIALNVENEGNYQLKAVLVEDGRRQDTIHVF